MNRENVKAVEARLWRIDEVLRSFNRPSDEPLRAVFLEAREATLIKLESLRNRGPAGLETRLRNAFADAGQTPDTANPIERVA